ncbi:uncharacterized protein LOC115447216 [Manduca sexta]|uniref:Uncharacterized protein n=1 Tax=Manduca sexta TaxID=7130 RepID=A0A921ZE57_MANSE|nr:uncharacterized protein LOC115447216 [Manduca sexta]KAG6455910.1 hypothetical protein O3G_MSEX009455 [Manduca sexta]
MCIIKINLPNIESFLLLYSLKCGCIVILAWTFLRSLFCLLFFIVAILEVFTSHRLPVGTLLIQKKETITEDNALTVYVTFVALVIGEAFLFGHTYYLIVGLYCEQSRLLEPYLICRFVSWLTEIICIFVLCLIHKLLIGWYLGMLMFIILEIYFFIVVYSYYVNLADYERTECRKSRVRPCDTCP